ncbi:MAG: small subunit ribosomal protein S15, partial [Flavobacteriaceae bacterium]
MYLSPEEKGKIFKKHGKSEKDSGTAEGQIA